MSVTVYGIPNCDSVRKARAWLSAHGVENRFHDYKKLGIDRVRLARWADAAGWEALLNRSGTTFRGLPEQDRADIGREGALALMAAHPSLIKRPVVAHRDGLLVGFKPETYQRAFD